MKKIFLIIVMLVSGEYALSQNTCKVSILEIADTSLCGVIDSLLSLEQSIGTTLSHNDQISIYFFETTGLYCIIHYDRDTLSGRRFLPVDEKIRPRIAYYRGKTVVVSGFAPNERIMKATGRYISVPCDWPSDQELLVEDYVDYSLAPNFSVWVKWYNNRMQIYIISDKDGNTIYNIPQ